MLKRKSSTSVHLNYRSEMMINLNKLRGVFGEYMACIYLRLRGWKILQRNYRHPLGEIDIIARKGDIICAIEVKWRKHHSDYPVSFKQQKRIKRSFERYLHKHHSSQPLQQCRIDIIVITPLLSIRHIKNAFDQA